MIPAALQQRFLAAQGWLDSLDEAVAHAGESKARTLVFDGQDWRSTPPPGAGERIIVLLPAESVIRRTTEAQANAGHRLEAIAKLQGLGFSPWPAGREQIALIGQARGADGGLRLDLLLCDRDALMRAQESSRQLGARLCAVRAQGDEDAAYDLRGPRRPFRTQLRIAGAAALGLVALGALIGASWGQFSAAVSSRAAARDSANTPIQMIERLAQALLDSSSLSALEWAGGELDIQVETADSKAMAAALGKARFRTLKEFPVPKGAPAGAHLIVQTREANP